MLSACASRFSFPCRQLLILLTSFSLYLSTVGSAHAATYYVATNGHNANPGTEASPWKTIAYAVNKMMPGDTTYVKGGIYNEGEIRFKRSGTQSAPIKLLAAKDAFPVIDFGTPTGGYSEDGPSGGRIHFEHDNAQQAIGWITLEGFEIKDGYNGIKFKNLHNTIIRRNWIHNNASQGILGHGGHHLLFDRNRVNHNGDFATCAAGGLTHGGTDMCNQQHGFYMYGSSYTLTNNIIYDNLAFGVQVNGNSSRYNPENHPGQEFAGAGGWIIANNTFAHNNNRGAMTLWGGLVRDIRIENNIFYKNCTKAPSKCGNVQGISIGSGAQGVNIKNNLFYANSGATIPFTRDRQLTESGNIMNTVDPNFVNVSGADFHLSSGSPAIDKGLPLTTEVTWDFDGGQRPHGTAFDIGAYEFGSPPDSGSPSIPPTGGGGFSSGPPVLLGPNGEVCYSGY